MIKNKALRITTIFALAGLVILLLVAYVERSIIKDYKQKLPFVKLGEHVKNDVIQAGFYFEELMGGNNSIEFAKDVVPPITSSQRLLQAAYDGADTEIGTFKKSTDEELLALLKESLVDVEKFSESVNQRWELKRQGGYMTDSLGNMVSKTAIEADQQFQVNLQKLQITIDRFTTYVNKDVQSGVASLNFISWLSISIFIIALAILGTYLYRMQRGNDKLVVENAARMSQQMEAVQSLSNFIEAISAGDYNVELKLEGDENLGNSLVKMRDKLRQNAQDDKRRNWSTAGLAEIGGILRSSTESSSELFDNIIQFVVKYTNCNQGGLFILSDESEGAEQYLELVSCYAFERKKFMTRKVELGQGLIGQCFQEGQKIYLLQVPQDYVNITSGLGGANPNALLLMPMKVNERIYGVIELASFKPFEEYQIELIEKFAESIASTISTVRVNETTRVLLEKTREQAEAMRSQEEEIRQNMEELEATQEEMRRKQSILERELDQSQKQAEQLQEQEKTLRDSQDTLQAIVDNIPRAIFWKDKDLRFQGCNRIFADVAGLGSPREIIGHTDFDMPWSAQAEEYRKDDLEVMNSRRAKLDIEEVNVNSGGEETWVLTSKVPIVNQTGQVVAVLGMFEDITARKRQEADIKQKLLEREQALKELKELKKKLEAR